MSNLHDLVALREPEKAIKKRLSRTRTRIFRYSYQVLAAEPDETTRRYLHVTIDRATRWVYMDVYADQTTAAAQHPSTSLAPSEADPVHSRNKWQVVEPALFLNVYITERVLTINDPNNHLVDELRSRFPADAEATDHWLRERGWDPSVDNVAFVWVEAFADRTTEAILRRDQKAVRAHTTAIAAAYRASPEALRTIVDVSYAENLMWNAGADDKVWAWESIAAQIQQFYSAIWGDPTLEQH